MNTPIPGGGGHEGVRLTFVSTGTVRIKIAMKSQPIANRNVTMRRLRAIVDRQWSEELPIGVFILSHPEGPILFDTGESPHVNEPGFRSAWSPSKMFATTQILPEHGIVHQLRANGVEPKDLQAIVLSHLHGDHAGGLQDLLKEAQDIPVYISQAHWDAFGKHPFFAALQGCNPAHWPNPFEPRLLLFSDGSVGPWKQSSKITSDGSILAVATPGHVPGHVSLVVQGISPNGVKTTYFLPADATYSVDLLDKEEPDGINDDPVGALQSLRLIKEFANQVDLVVLPSHDPKTPQLLKERVVYKPRF
ncbi:Metallo-hydrolase/oxidoreductase [Thozetella sp. PMI_491]|nr:Metallo-hydrolase/oxidoreductase [Thozetella sp. PMI_491]